MCVACLTRSDWPWPIKFSVMVPRSLCGLPGQRALLWCGRRRRKRSDAHAHWRSSLPRLQSASSRVANLGPGASSTGPFSRVANVKPHINGSGGEITTGKVCDEIVRCEKYSDQFKIRRSSLRHRWSWLLHGFWQRVYCSYFFSEVSSQMSYAKNILKYKIFCCLSWMIYWSVWYLLGCRVTAHSQKTEESPYIFDAASE